MRIVRFETFGTRSRPVRTGHNPRTGESMEIAASTTPNYQHSALLSEGTPHVGGASCFRTGP